MDIQAGRINPGLIEHKKKHHDKDYEFLYHNIVLPYNYNAADLNLIQPAQYDANLNSALLESPSKWQMAVSRSSLETAELPLLIPQVDPITQTTDWLVTLVYSTNGNSYQLPVPFIQRQTLKPGYDKYYPTYAVYAYSHVCDMFNTAFAATMVLLNAAETLAYTAPEMIFEPNTGKFAIVVNKAQFDTAQANHVTIRFNHQVEHLFQSFPYILDFTREGQELELVSKLTPNNYWPDLYDATQTQIQIRQEYSSLSMWNPVASVQVRTSMPVKPQFIPQDYAARANLNGVNIIRDYIPILRDNNTTVRSYIVNTVTDYEWNDMVGSSPLKHINASFYWQDVYGQSYQLLISKHTVNSIKLAFRRRLTDERI